MKLLIAPEEKMIIGAQSFAEYLTDEITLRKLVTGNKVTELRNVGTFAYKINFKWENHLKKIDSRLIGELFFM